jgi:hypothetical protein
MMRRAKWITTAVLIALTLSGGAMAFSWSPYGVAMLKSRDQFLVNPGDPRVLYEPGMGREAALVARSLPVSIATVEEKQGLPMRDAFRVYICASQGSFNEYMAAPPSAAAQGVKVMNDIFLSPLAFSPDVSDSHSGVLTHELSHLHLYQRMGHMRTLWDTPPWFLEGLAVMVSGAGGRDLTAAQARDAILSGYHFEPDDSGSLLRPKRAADYGLDTFMFYRQSELFVRYLRDAHGAEFSRFLQLLQGNDGGRFADAFRRSFGTDVAGMWGEFASSLKRQL